MMKKEKWHTANVTNHKQYSYRDKGLVRKAPEGVEGWIAPYNQKNNQSAILLIPLPVWVQTILCHSAHPQTYLSHVAIDRLLEDFHWSISIIFFCIHHFLSCCVYMLLLHAINLYLNVTTVCVFLSFPLVVCAFYFLAFCTIHSKSSC